MMPRETKMTLYLSGFDCHFILHVGETGASCYNFHSKSLFHKNMQARDFFGRDPVI